MVNSTTMARQCWRMGVAAAFAVLHVFGGVGHNGSTFAQQPNVHETHALEDSLAKLGYTMYNEPSEPERLAANFAFVKTLVSALKAPYSYTYPFDSLDMVSILDAPDSSFRVFSWHIQLNDGSYLYYGTIQLNTPDGSLELYPLLDKTYEITAPEEVVTDPDNWYGAQYYRIIPLNDAYVLLGWKGHTPYITQKVIEVLRFTETGVQLGKPVFEAPETAMHVRAVYRYSKNASMHLDYDAAENRIVFDHLAPADQRQQGQYEQYGPDLTYDAWQLGNGRLVLISDVPLKNPPSSNDNRFNDPTKPQNHPKSGLNIQ